VLAKTRREPTVGDLRYLDTADAPSDAPAPKVGVMDQGFAAQRRQLTVMFCDLAGSTELSARLDPEDMHDIIAAFHRAATDCIEAAGGFVAKYMGDGVLAYFGYPQAHEDDAERALHAGVEITTVAPRLPTPHGDPLAVRVGVATGVVVVGELIGAGPAQERNVVGETPNLAARLQALAAPNRVVVAETTRQLAAGLFEFRDLGRVVVKGLGEERVWEVAGASPAADRFRARHEGGPTAMVNRIKEVEKILERWRACRGGAGQVVGVTGEPGIGKSRLVYEIRKEIARRPHIWLEGGGARIFQNTPFYAISQMIQRRLGRYRRLEPEEYLERLAQSLDSSGMPGDEPLALIADLIGVPTGAGQAPLTLSADERRRALLSTLADWLLATAERWPTMVVIDDLHWVDPSTLELLDVLIGRAAGSRLMLLYTARSDFPLPWAPGDAHLQLPLERLDREDARRLVTAAASRDLPPDLIDRAVNRAGGVPLFAEELARLFGQDKGRRSEREIPSSLSDLLMARLDQLGSAKQVAQIASVLGREFRLPLLRAVSGLPDEELEPALQRLSSADILAPQGARGDHVYAFRHSLIQDAAYEALLKRHRRELHGRAARIIAEDAPETISAQPEVLAQHWAGAGEAELALEAWREAGRSGIARRAFKEAQRAYEQALVLLQDLPESRRRDERELELQSSLSGVLQITRGYSAPQTVAAAARARELAERGGKLHQQLSQLASEWMALSSAGDYAAAGAVAEQLMPLARADGSGDQLAGAYMIQMTSRFRVGDLLGAEEAFTAGAAYFVSPRFCRRPGAAAQTFGNAARIAWIRGDGSEARRRMERGLVISRGADSPYDLAFALYMTGILAVLDGELSEGEALARQAMELCDAHGFPQFAGISRIVLGRARAGLGGAEEGVTLIREGLAGLTSTGARVGVTMYLAWLAEALALAGRLPDALQALDQALDVNIQEASYRPEVLRLRGELRARAGAVDAARADLGEALELAKAMGAVRFHQHAAASLARLA
jgi:class 3 adenylate cyclase/tetratricopeptide (TPR) repeat protein